jgi:hypothetical protein
MIYAVYLILSEYLDQERVVWICNLDEENTQIEEETTRKTATWKNQQIGQ